MKTRAGWWGFAGGEITPEMVGAIHDAKRQTGLAKCRNAIVLPHGPVQRRPGTMFVAMAKYVEDEQDEFDRRVRLIPFNFGAGQSYVLEFGSGYIRFHQYGRPIDPDTLEIETPWYFNTDTDPRFLEYEQSFDVLTLTHPATPVHELRRLAWDDWELEDLDFSPFISPPTGASADGVIPAQPGVPTNYQYVVTSVKDSPFAESGPSAVAREKWFSLSSGNVIKVSWNAVASADRYYVYRAIGGVFGYIGAVDAPGLELDDDNIVPDTSKTPPRYSAVFDDDGKYPCAVTYFEQRRVFAGSINFPSNLWMTRSGSESDMSYSIPTQDDDRIELRVAAREASMIRHVVPLAQLLLLSESSEWRVTSANSDVLTATTTSVRPQSYIGSSWVRPVVVGSAAMFASAAGGHLYEIGYNWQASGFVTGDACVRAAHLFDGHDIVDLAFCRSPIPIVWACSSNGSLLGLTYMPDQGIGAWHQHDTVAPPGNGLSSKFISCCSVVENGQHALYVAVKRGHQDASDSGQVFIERLGYLPEPEGEGGPVPFKSPFHLDCAVIATQGQQNNHRWVEGLEHLEGQEVAILADGAVMPRQVVTDGKVQLFAPGEPVEWFNEIVVGLPMETEIQTLPLAMQTNDSSFGFGRVKAINRVWLRVRQTLGIWVGLTGGKLTEHKARTTENYGEPPRPRDGEIEIALPAGWNDDGSITITTDEPFPLMLLSMTAELEIGG